MEALLNEQIRLHGRLLFRLAYGVLRNSQSAEDACQQTFLKAWDQRGRIQDQRALKAWLARVVVNESFQILRRRNIEKKVLYESSVLKSLCDRSENEAMLRGSVLEAVGKLPEPQRTVVTLRIMRGISGNEVKEMLDCSASEVSRLLHSGMEQLRRLLSDWQIKGGG